jgi:hypothetical protein
VLLVCASVIVIVPHLCILYAPTCARQCSEVSLYVLHVHYVFLCVICMCALGKYAPAAVGVRRFSIDFACVRARNEKRKEADGQVTI